MDMSQTSAEDLHFPVLFPGLDAANHSNNAKVDWTFDPGRFSIALAKAEESQGIDPGEEVFNNYGPKSNGELLIGYGFCIENNPHDTVAMMLKAPPEPLQDELKAVHQGYFTLQGAWKADKATFYLKKPDISPQTSSGLVQRPQIFHQLPEPLLELLLYILRHERGLPLEFAERPLAHLTDLESPGRRYLPHIARMIVQSLAPKLAKLQYSTPEKTPRSKKQQQASIYREGQVQIISALIAALKTYTRALIFHGPVGNDLPKGPTLLALSQFLQILNVHELLTPVVLRGIYANSGTTDTEQLRSAGWEEDVWVLILTWLIMDLSTLPSWLQQALGEGVAAQISGETKAMHPDTDMAYQQAAELIPLIQTAAAVCPDSRWQDLVAWGPSYIAATGGAVMRHDSFLVMSRLEGEQEEPRLFVYFHF
jgi:hypothetical protein